MKHILKTTDMRRYTYIAAGGTEPLRNYRKTLSLLQSRLRDSYPDFSDMLAIPVMQSDGNIEWTTEQFSSLPRPLSTLSGNEREYYSDLLHDSMTRLKRALASLPADSDVDELHAIASVPSEQTIYCADNRIVIAEWGLRPSAGGAPLSLLSFADTASPKPKAPTPTVAEVKPEPKPAPAVTVAPAPVPAVPTDPSTPKVDESTPEPTAKETETPATPPPPAVPVVPPTVPDTTSNSGAGKGKKKSRAWLWILLALLGALIAFAIVMLLTRCSTTESVATLPATSPEIKDENIVLSDDSVSYIVNNRLNIMVLDGGTLDDFIKDFRKEFPDKKRYALSAPDTVVNHVVLTLPPEDVKEMKKQIPAKMEPKYSVIVAAEGINIGSYVPADPAMSSTKESYYFDMINAPEAWDIQKGDPNVIVAVLDDGFELSHPELKGKTVAPYDMYRNQPGTLASQSGHGQHTSCTVGGTADNNSGACGVAPGCKIMPINVFTPNQGAPDSLIMKGLVYAAKNGAKVVSISIGRYFGPYMKFLSVDEQEKYASQYMPELAEMYDELFRKLDEMGVTVVIAAGNETVLADMDPMKRSSYPIIVSAVDPDCNLAIFNSQNLDGSNWGDRCDISAPGILIYNAVPGGYDYKNGTSMSCPQVAGGAALVLSQHPDLTPQEIKKLLVTTAVPVDEHIGPLMDLAAALKADPDNLPEAPTKNPAQQPQKRGNTTRKVYTDPYEFFFSQQPSPSPRTQPTPGKPTPTPTPGKTPSQRFDPMDCAEAAREMQKLQKQYEELMQRYGACL